MWRLAKYVKIFLEVFRYTVVVVVSITNHDACMDLPGVGPAWVQMLDTVVDPQFTQLFIFPLQGLINWVHGLG